MRGGGRQDRPVPLRQLDGRANWRKTIDETHLRELLQRFKKDGLTLEDAVQALRDLPYQELDFAKVDHHRAIRKGFPEVIFGEGKSPQQVALIAEAILSQSDVLLVTRASQEVFSAVRANVSDASYHETARAVVVDRRSHRECIPGVLVVCAGTADLPVAAEATLTAARSTLADIEGPDPLAVSSSRSAVVSDHIR